VPYKGIAPALSDLLAGQVEMAFETMVGTLPYVQTGKLRALALAGPERNPLLPDVPTTVESGLSPRYRRPTGAAWWRPPAPPSPVIERLNRTINDILRTPALGAALEKLNARPQIGSPDDFAAFMTAERRKWTGIVAAAGITAD